MPFVSIIIPTIGRMPLLGRAIDSCLSGKYAHVTEIIVIANGLKCRSDVLANLCEKSEKIRLIYSEIADQNNARNIGIELARGEVVRFLDDDDYLNADAADVQYALMENKNIDFCSASISLCDEQGRVLGISKQPLTNSAEIAALSRDRLQLVHAHVYRRSTIESLRWPTNMKQSEDIFWLIQYVARSPRRWGRSDEVVGVWYQHSLPRQSVNRPSGKIHESTAQAVLHAREILQSQKRWSTELSLITSDALWQIVHRAFPFRPLYWSRIGISAWRMHKKSRPNYPVYRYPLLAELNPLVVLWLLLPKRWVSLGDDLFRALWCGRDYRRKL